MTFDDDCAGYECRTTQMVSHTYRCPRGCSEVDPIPRPGRCLGAPLMLRSPLAQGEMNNDHE